MKVDEKPKAKVSKFTKVVYVRPSEGKAKRLKNERRLVPGEIQRFLEDHDD